MVVACLIWMYILWVSITIGWFVLETWNRKWKLQNTVGFVPAYMAGTVLLNTFAQYYSLFAKIAVIPVTVVLVITIVIVVRKRKEYMAFIQKQFNKYSLQIWILFGLIFLVSLFFTTRGVEHGDTGLYHGQAIRWIEEYPVIKGLGNLFANYAYNSSWFSYAALFSFSFLGMQSFHVMNGLLMAMMTAYCMGGLLSFQERKVHLADAVRIAMLFYGVVVCVVAMSPSTDLPSMYIAMYIILRWCENLEEKKDLHSMALMSILAVYALTIKLSAGLLVLLVLQPVFILIKRKEWKKMAVYFGLGVGILIPFLVRNYILSGWLLYPFESLDLFHVEWKIPLKNLLVDKDYLTVFARKTYDPSLVNQSLREWFPIWWSESEQYDRMLFLAQFFGMGLMGSSLLLEGIKKHQWRIDLFFLDVILFLNMMFWFLEAPFVRYGLAFLLIIPCLGIAHIQRESKFSFSRLFMLGGGLIILTCITPYWNHYVNDTLLFVKQNLSAPYYVVPKDYDKHALLSYEINGITFYYGDDTDKTGYYGLPGSPLENTHIEMMGDRLQDGFRVKDK